MTPIIFSIFLKRFLIRPNKKEDKDVVESIITKTGYSYDTVQKIFYSNINAWQRKYGYCRLYDEMLLPNGMIVDCEPVYFKYNGRKWLIEFWKGQYDLSMGGEIGFYVADGRVVDIPKVFTGTLYEAVPDDQMIDMKFILNRKGIEEFSRQDTSWWLTGFRVGEYAEPEDLTMDITLSFKETLMCDAFIESLEKMGYTYERTRNTVNLMFDKPKSKQPLNANEETIRMIQKKNKLLCYSYQKFIRIFSKFTDVVKLMKEIDPELFERLALIGKTEKTLEKIEHYIV